MTVEPEERKTHERRQAQGAGAEEDAQRFIALGDSLRSSSTISGRWSGLEEARDKEQKRRALAAYEQALALKPESVAALTGIGQTYLDLMFLGLWWEAPLDEIRAAADSAEQHLNRALELDPNYGPALAALTEVLFRKIDTFGLDPTLYDTAAECARRLLPQDPLHGWYLLGRIYRLIGEHTFALDALQKSVALDSTSFPACLALGWLCFDLGQHHLGIPVLAKAAELDPQSTTARNLLGFSYIHIGRADLAQRPFDESIALALSEHSVGGQLMIRISRRDFDGAIAYTESVRQREPEAGWSWARLGEAYFFAGRDEEAVHAFEEALARDPSSENQYTWKATALPLAYLYLKAGRAEEAAPLLERSYQHADRFWQRGQEPWNAHYQYAALALTEGRRAEALRWLRTAHTVGMPGRVFIEYDPLLSALHGDPGFDEIVRKLRGREEEIQRRLGLRSEDE